MQIPTICSLSSVLANNDASILNTIHALGGRGIGINKQAEMTLNACGSADIMQLLDVPDVALCIKLLTSFRQQDQSTPIAISVPIDIELSALLQIASLVDLVIFNHASLAAMNGAPLTSSKAVKVALLQFSEVAEKTLSTSQKPAFIYQAGTLDKNEVEQRHWDTVDICLQQDNEYVLQSPATNNHGLANELFSTALVTAFAQDYPLDDALVIARAYCNQTVQLGRCHGWPKQRKYFPTVVLPNSATGAQLGMQTSMELSCDFPACDTNQLGLYPVVDSLAWLEKVLQQGVKTLQLRIKDKADAEVEGDIQAAVALGKHYQARLFINDYWQLAIKHNAYGVHLGQEDMLVADFAAIKQAGLRLGLSTHGYYEILRAHAIKPSYIALGHIFPTVTKDMPSKPQGLLRLQKYADLMQDYPLVAIGGISLARAPQVAATGVGSIAVVTAITRAENYQQAITDFQQVMVDFGIIKKGIVETSSQRLEVNYG